MTGGQWTCLKGLSTPAYLHIAHWVDDESDPSHPANMGTFLARDLRLFDAVARWGIITATITGRHVTAAITPHGRACLRLNQPVGVYAALAPTGHAAITAHIINHPGCVPAHAATATNRTLHYTANATKTLDRVGIIHAAQTLLPSCRLTAHPIAARLLDAAGIPYALPEAPSESE